MINTTCSWRKFLQRIRKKYGDWLGRQLASVFHYKGMWVMNRKWEQRTKAKGDFVLSLKALLLPALPKWGHQFSQSRHIVTTGEQPYTAMCGHEDVNRDRMCWIQEPQWEHSQSLYSFESDFHDIPLILEVKASCAVKRMERRRKPLSDLSGVWSHGWNRLKGHVAEGSANWLWIKWLCFFVWFN